MNQHTPGRLKIGRIDHENQHVEIDAESTRAYLNCFPWENLATCYGEERNPERGSAVMEANARRLVACWNAFEGISTKGIEAISALGGVQHKMPVTAALVAQRDELLAALKEIATTYVGGNKFQAIARAAIAKAEGGGL